MAMNEFLTTEEFAVEHLRIAVSNVLNNIGFSAINEESLNIIIDIARRFMVSLCGKSKFYAEHAGRTQLIPNDLALAFRKMQFSTVELYDYLEQVGNLKTPTLSVPQFPVSHSRNQPFFYPPPTEDELLTRPEHIPSFFPRMWMPKKSEDYLAVKPVTKKNAPPQFPDFANMTAFDLKLAKRIIKPIKRHQSPDVPISSVKERITNEKHYDPPPIIDVPDKLCNPKKKKRDYTKKVKTSNTNTKPKNSNKRESLDVQQQTPVPKKPENASPMPLLQRVNDEYPSKNFSKKSLNGSLQSSIDSGSSNDSFLVSEEASTSVTNPKSNKPSNTNRSSLERTRRNENVNNEQPIIKNSKEDIDGRREQAELEEKLRTQMLLEAEAQARRTARDATPPMRMEVSSSSSNGLKIVISNPHARAMRSEKEESAVSSPVLKSISPCQEDAIVPASYSPLSYIGERSKQEQDFSEKVALALTDIPITPNCENEDLNNLSDATDPAMFEEPEKPKKHKKHKKEKKSKKEKEKDKKKSKEKNRHKSKRSHSHKEKRHINVNDISENKIKLTIRLSDPQPSPIICSPDAPSPAPIDSNMKLRIKLSDDKPASTFMPDNEQERKVPKLKLGLPLVNKAVERTDSRNSFIDLNVKYESNSPAISSKSSLKVTLATPEEEKKKSTPEKLNGSSKKKLRKESNPHTCHSEKKRRKREPSSKQSDDKTSNVGDSADEEIWICPACSVAWTEDATMIGCDNCDNWFHWNCVGIYEAPAEDMEWYCQKCQIKRMKKTGEKRHQSFASHSHKKKK